MLFNDSIGNWTTYIYWHKFYNVSIKAAKKSKEMLAVD